MATTNYNLPTILGTNAFDLVTDYNALANAVDTALALLAGEIPTDDITVLQGQISALQTSVSGNTSGIQQINGQIGTMNDNISALQTGLSSANSNIGSLQVNLQTANTNISNMQTDISALFSENNFESGYLTGTQLGSNINSSNTLYYMRNADQTIVKIFGAIQCVGSATRVSVPGATYASGSPLYGYKTNMRLVTRVLTTGYLVTYAGIEGTSSGGVTGCNYAIGSDGYVYVFIGGSATISTASTFYFLNVPVWLDTPVSVIES